jgi:hypothetical protein
VPASHTAGNYLLSPAHAEAIHRLASHPAVIYAEETLQDCLCPWCIADGSAHDRFDATFVDSEAFPDGTPQAAIGSTVLWKRLGEIHLEDGGELFHLERVERIDVEESGLQVEPRAESEGQAAVGRRRVP